MRFFTIGYGGRIPKEFVQLLSEKGVSTVVDVRLRPDRASMGAYVKAKTSDKGIERLLSDGKIKYVSIIELGNIFLDFEDWRKRYRSLLGNNGALLTERLKTVTDSFCLLCAEKKISDCHRQQISEYLTLNGYELVEHIE